jgi:hypothetical protein
MQDLTVEDSRDFEPSRTQSSAKARFWSRLREQNGLVELSTLTKAEVVQLSGSRHVEGWLRDPKFALWFFDKDSLTHRLQALKETAVDVLEEVLLSEYQQGVLTAKDKLKAADLLLQVTGSFPSRTKEVVFADERISKMTEDEVDKELKALKGVLSLTST